MGRERARHRQVDVGVILSEYEVAAVRPQRRCEEGNRHTEEHRSGGGDGPATGRLTDHPEDLEDPASKAIQDGASP